MAAMLDEILSELPAKFKKSHIPYGVMSEAKKRVVDSFGCFFGAYLTNPSRALRKTYYEKSLGPCCVWAGLDKASPEVAAMINGTGVRALDFNDTYLSKEPCHPSDLIASLWAACEMTPSRRQGKLLLKAMVLGYEVVCRLCDAHSLRKDGWDHVNYIGIASAVACSYIFGLSARTTRHAIALTVVANNAMRQTRVGTISDWKAACAAHAAKAGFQAALMARQGMTGPSDIFSGPHGFFNQVSGPFRISLKGWGEPWKIMETHTKFYPAEHHAQSAIEAAVSIYPAIMDEKIRKVVVESFDASIQIIGSEKEKWRPETRETADHSLHYLVAIALLQGGVNLKQYALKAYLKPSVRDLMKRIVIKRSERLNKLYPKYLPARVTVTMADGTTHTREVIQPKGYAGRPMSKEDIMRKFDDLARPILSEGRRRRLMIVLFSLDRLSKLKSLINMTHVGF